MAFLVGSSWPFGVLLGVGVGLGLFRRKREVYPSVKVRILFLAIALLVALNNNWSSYKAGVTAGYDAAAKNAIR